MNTDKIKAIVQRMTAIAPSLSPDNPEVIERLKDLAIELFSELD